MTQSTETQTYDAEQTKELKSAAWDAREALVAEFGDTATERVTGLMDDSTSATDAARAVVELADFMGVYDAPEVAERKAIKNEVDAMRRAEEEADARREMEAEANAEARAEKAREEGRW